MERKDILKALEICQRDRSDPDFDHEGQGCTLCPYDDKCAPIDMTLICRDLLRDLQRLLEENDSGTTS